MYRFAYLIQEELKSVQIREISRATGLAIASIHDYAYMPKEPRLSQLKKLADYFGESIGQLVSEDDQLTADLITTVRNLSEQQKRDLQHHIQQNIIDTTPPPARNRTRQSPKTTPVEISTQ